MKSEGENRARLASKVSSVKVARYTIMGELFSGESSSLLFVLVSLTKRKVGRLILEGRIWRLWVGGGGNEGRTLVFFSSVSGMPVTRDDSCLFWAGCCFKVVSMLVKVVA